MPSENHAQSERNPFPRTERRAVIDVGSNAVKLLVADVGGTIKPVLKLSLQTSLGQGAFASRRLRPEAIARTVDAVAGFADEAAELQASSIRVVATCAVRDALNRHEFVEALQRTTGLSVEVISGEQEAEYVFQGVASDPRIGSQPVMIVDVGGGSTEWVLGERGFIHFCMSTPLGTARLLDQAPLTDPPTPAALACCRALVQDFLATQVCPRLQRELRFSCGRPVRLVGLGGALHALTRLSSSASTLSGQDNLLRREKLVEQVNYVWGLTLQQRRELPELDQAKAEVILPGAVIHEAVLEQFGFEEILVSSRGLREGLLLSTPVRPDPSGSALPASPTGRFESACPTPSLSPFQTPREDMRSTGTGRAHL